MENTAEYYYDLAHQLQYSSKPGNLLDNMLQAIKYMDQAIQLDPENLKYYMERANLKSSNEDYDFGIDDFTRVIENSQDMDVLQKAYASRAISYAYASRTRDWLADLTWLIDHNLASDMQYVERGNYWWRSEQWEQAIQDYTKAHDLRPGNGPTDPVIAKRANCLYKLGRYEEALQDLAPLAFPDDYPADWARRLYHWRGLTYYKLGTKQQALVDFNEALRLLGEAAVENAADYISAHELDS